MINGCIEVNGQIFIREKIICATLEITYALKITSVLVFKHNFISV